MSNMDMPQVFWELIASLWISVLGLESYQSVGTSAAAIPWVFFPKAPLSAYLIATKNIILLLISKYWKAGF